MVISYKIGENLMGYRGSKSILRVFKRANIVKEQRVDGSWFIKTFKSVTMNLRYTLMGCESGHHIKNLSNQLNKLPFHPAILSACRWKGIVRPFSTLNLNTGLATQPLATLDILGAREHKNLNPWFITGFADAESNFTCSIVSDSRSKLK